MNRSLFWSRTKEREVFWRAWANAKPATDAGNALREVSEACCNAVLKPSDLLVQLIIKKNVHTGGANGR
jgi:hypothetical protein